MRRALQLTGLSGLLVTGFLSTYAFAQEPTDAEEPAEAQPPATEPKTGPQAPLAPVAVVAAPPAPAPAPVVPDGRPKVGDFTAHGYFRGGFGANVHEKGRMTCFQLNLGGLLSKYRLGNECEVWAELNTTTVVYAGDDGSVASLHFMPVAFIPTSYIGYTPTGVTSSDNGSPGTGATVAFPNLYADIKGIPWLFGATAWLGTRYYKRESIYISDFFYWNPSGVGAGIEDMSLGKIWDSAPDVVRDLTFSYGVFAVDGEPAGTPQLPYQIDLGIRNDFQIRDLRLWGGADFQFGFQYIKDWSNDYSEQQDPNDPTKTYMKPNTHSGWGATFQYVQDVLGGNNKLAVQYGVGGGTGFGTLSRFYYPDFSLRYDTSEWRFRALDVLTIQPLAWLGVQANVVYQHDKNSTPAAGNWYSAGGRASFAFTEHAKVLGEIGYDKLKPAIGSGERSLLKGTVAVALASAKGFWARPELRLFYTYAVWNENARIAGIDSGRIYTDNPDYTKYLSGMLAGLQAEAMW
jgi:maltoporin